MPGLWTGNESNRNDLKESTENHLFSIKPMVSGAHMLYLFPNYLLL